jgi:hypothetical protein
VAEGAVRAGLGGPVTDAFGGAQRRLRGRGPVDPISLPVQERIQPGREPPGPDVEARLGGVGHGRDEDVVFGGEPAHRLVAVGELLGGHARARFAERHRVAAVREQQTVGAGGGVHVVIEHPAQRRPAFVGAGELGRVLA